MSYKVDVRNYRDEIEVEVEDFKVCLARTDLVVAQGFFTRPEAESWIKKYNNMQGEKMLELVDHV